jgi:hypothetical protein
MEQKQELRLLKRFEEDSKWFHENIDQLRKDNLTGRFVAIKDKKAIASDNNLDITINSVVKQGENPSYLFIEFVYPEGFTLLL